MNAAHTTLAVRLFAAAALCLSATDLTAGPTLHVPRDFPTIQGALDAAQPGDRVLVAPGEYRESLSMLYADNVILEGRKGAVILPVDDEKYALRIEDCRGITVRRLKFQNGIELVTSIQITLERLKVEATRGEGVSATRVDDLAIDRCNLRGTGTAGIYVRDSQRLRVTRNKIRDAGATGIAVMEITAPSPDALIQDNLIERSASFAILTRGSGASLIQNAAIDCRGMSCTGDGSLVKGNVVIDSWHHGIVAGGEGTSVLRNTVRGGETFGCQLFGDDLLAADNRVKKSAGSAIYHLGDRAIFQRNKIRASGGHGLHIQGNRNLVRQCRIKKAGQTGMYVRGNFNELSRNTALLSQEYDLSIRGQQNVYDDNRFGTLDPDN